MRRFSYLLMAVLFSVAVRPVFGQASGGQGAGPESGRETIRNAKTPPPVCRTQKRVSAASSEHAPIASVEVPQEVQSALKESADGDRSSALRPEVMTSYGRLPLSFEVNVGQTDESVRFLSRGLGYALFLNGREAVLSLRQATPSKPKTLLPVRERSAAVVETTKFHAGKPSEREARPVVVRTQLINANLRAKVVGLDELPGKSNYFIGNDPKKWHSDVPTYAKVKYQDVYPGVDLVYYGNRAGQLEYDFVVAPRASLKQVRLAIVGDEPASDRQRHKSIPIHIDANGNLVATTAKGEMRWQRPVAYQIGSDGGKQLVSARFIIKSKHEVGFAVGFYDPSKVLVIDPTLIYSTYIAGATSGPYYFGYAGDQTTSITVDSSGSAYIAGLTISADFPITPNPGAYQTNLTKATAGSPQYSAFVAKLSANGSTLLYSTYVGGSYDEQANAIAVDPSGNAYIAGQTFSPDFPTTAGAYQTSCGPRLDTINAFYCDGSHIVSTCGAPGSGASQDGFVAKLNSSGSSLLYSTFLGGSLTDTLSGIAVNSAGEAYVVGQTLSVYDYSPPTGSCGCPNGPGTCDPNSNVSASYGYPITPTGFFPGALPAPPSGYQLWPFGPPSAFTLPSASVSAYPWNGPSAAVFSKLSADGKTLLYSTYFGGGFGPVLAGGDQWGHFQTYEPNLGQGATGIAIDASGDAYVSGYSNASDQCCTAYGGNQYADIPTTTGVFQPHNASSCYAGGCKQDAFVAKFDPKLSGAPSLIYSTHLGSSTDDAATAIAVDSSGNAYVTGLSNTSSFGNGPNITPSNFPTTPGTFQPNCPGNCNSSYGWVAKLNSTATALDYSTFLSGTTSSLNTPYAIKTDVSGNAYVAGQTGSTDFPLLNPIQAFAGPGNDAFVSVLSPTASGLLFSTFLGGPSSGGQGASGIALDGSDNIFVAGSTTSSSFPTTTGAFQPACAKCASGSWGAFVAEISAVSAAATPATITLSNLSYTYNGTPKAATASTNPPNLTGISITYTGTGGTLYGPSTTPPTNAGSYSVDASLNNANYQASDATGTLLISPANQTISLAAIPTQTYGNPPFAISAAASSGLPVSLGATGNCSLSDTTVTITGAGSCMLTASQAGDVNFSAAANVSQTISILKANQTVSWPTPANIVYGTPLSGAQLNATVSVPGASVAGAMSYSPVAATVLGPGTGQTLAVSVAGTANYNPASATVKINVLYASGGICNGDVGHMILQPINADGSSVWKQGSTVPVKFRVCDVNGVSIGTAGVITNFALYKINSGTITAIDETAVNSTNDLAWHFDSTTQQWIFNLSTKTAPQNVPNQTYYYEIDLNDGTSILFRFGLR